MKQLVAVWSLVFTGFLFADAVFELIISYMFWRNRFEKDGALRFGFGQLSLKFAGSALFLLVFTVGLTTIDCPTSPALRWWILASLAIRAATSWPLALKYLLIPRD